MSAKTMIVLCFLSLSAAIPGRFITGRFITGRFITVVSTHGRFITRSFQHTVVSSHGRFNTGRFNTGRFNTVAVVKAQTVSFTAERYQFKKGEKIVLTCYISKSPNSAPTYHIDKTLNGNDTYQFQPENYDDTSKRILVEINTDDPSKIQMTLTVNNAVPGDSGNYSCTSYQNHVTTTRSLFITVEDEPDTIRFFLDDIEVLNSSLSKKLKPNSAYRLRCETTGSNPRANISVSLGNTYFPPSNVSNSSAIWRYDLRGDYPFVVPVEYNTTARFDRWVFTVDSTSQPVVCSAKVNKDAPGISTNFIPDIEEGPPVFVCNDSAFAVNGQKEFPINCTVYSKPNLNKASFFFNIKKVNQSINGYPWNMEHTATDRNYRGIVQPLNDLKFAMILTIGVTDTTSPIKFSFEAGNDRGTTIHVVDLLDRTKTSVASSVKSFATLLMALASILVFVIHA